MSPDVEDRHSENEPPTEREVFAYLDMLRASAVTNMYGAGHYLQRDMGCSRTEARDFVLKWIHTPRSVAAKEGAPHA